MTLTILPSWCPSSTTQPGNLAISGSSAFPTSPVIAITFFFCGFLFIIFLSFPLPSLMQFSYLVRVFFSEKKITLIFLTYFCRSRRGDGRGPGSRPSGHPVLHRPQWQQHRQLDVQALLPGVSTSSETRSRIGSTRRTLTRLRSFETRTLAWTMYMKFADLLISRLLDCERVRREAVKRLLSWLWVQAPAKTNHVGLAPRTTHPNVMMAFVNDMALYGWSEILLPGKQGSHGSKPICQQLMSRWKYQFLIVKGFIGKPWNACFHGCGFRPNRELTSHPNVPLWMIWHSMVEAKYACQGNKLVMGSNTFVSGWCQDGNTSSCTITEVKHLELYQCSDGRNILGSGECGCRAI